MSNAYPSFSAIIPTLNEAHHIVACISAVRALHPDIEVIVADGDSADDTTRLASEAGAVVHQAPRGRGPQCNAGAEVASGDVLVFLHADTQLPANAFQLLHQLFRNPEVNIAKFRLSFDTHDWLLDLAALFMWFDSVMTSYGDQCIVIRHKFFDELGGFPDWPLFEDVRLFELARQRTRVNVVPAMVTTSARRFRDNGVLKQLLSDVFHMVDYLTGVPPDQIAEIYEHGGARLRDAPATESSLQRHR